MAALTVYWSNAAATDLPNAALVIAPPTATGSHVGIDNALGTATGYSEWYFRGTLNAWASAGSIGGPSGHGALYDTTALEQEQIVAGTWSPTLRGNINNGNGTVTADLYLRVYVYNSTSATYTLIGTITRAGTSITSTTVSYSSGWSGSLSAAQFGVGDKLYFDLWADVTSNLNTNTAATMRWNVVSGVTNGDVNCEAVTPGTIFSYVESVTLADSLIATGASTLTDSVALVESVTNAGASTLTDTALTLTESLASQGATTLAESVTLAESLIATGAAATNYLSVILQDSPNGAYLLDETGQIIAYDQSVNRANGTLHGGVTPGGASALVAGLPGAATFDGVTGSVALPDGVTPIGTALTLECLVNLSGVSNTGYNRLFANDYPGSAPYDGFDFGIHNSGDFLFADFGTGSANTTCSVGGLAFGSGTHYLALVYNAGTVTFYLDGAEVGQSSGLASSLTAGRYALTIGQSATGFDFYQGALQAAAVYPTALSAARIAAHYAEGLAAFADGVTLAESQSGQGANSLSDTLTLAEMLTALGANSLTDPALNPSDSIAFRTAHSPSAVTARTATLSAATIVKQSSAVTTSTQPSAVTVRE